MWSGNRTLDEARAYILANADSGVDCPCCTQRVQRYRRTITGAMARALILIERRTRGSTDWLHVPTFLTAVNAGVANRGGDWSKLRYWELLEAKEGTRKDGNPRLGYWRVTDRGRDFVHGRIQVPKYVYVFNSIPVVGPGRNKLISIEAALGKKFSYVELLHGEIVQDASS